MKYYFTMPQMLKTDSQNTYDAGVYTTGPDGIEYPVR